MASRKWMWFGSIIAGLGWLLLFAGWLVPSFVPQAAPLLPAWTFVSVVAPCAIFSGFIIAILAVLTHGFGALERFFTAALERSAARAESPPIMAEPEPKPPSNRGIDESLFHIYGDGTVEVETLLGSRRFTSLQEAQEFVGIR